MKNNAQPFPKVAVLLVASTALGLLVWSRLSAPPAVPVAVIAGVDASQSVRDKNAAGAALLGQSRAALARLNAGLDSHDHLVVTRVDRRVSEFYAATPQSGSEKFLRLLVEETQTPASQGGTFPARFWKLAAARAADSQSSPGEAVVVVFYGDGDNDDLSPNSQRAIAAAARQLAANSRVTGVWLFGIKRDNWALLRALLAPLGGKLHLAGKSEMSPAPVLQHLDAVRRERASSTKAAHSKGS